MMHYFQFNWKDYIADTHSMSFVQHGAYIKLMGEFYRGEVPLPLSLEEINDLVAPRTEEEVNAVKYILKRFFTETENGFIQKRALAEIEIYRANVEKREKAARVRWSKEKEGDIVDASAMHVQSTCNANKEPRTKNNKQHIAPPEGVDDSIWQDFKKLRDRKKAPITDAAFKQIQNEAKKAGWTLNAALTECCARGWTGFKAEWVNKEEQKVVPLTVDKRVICKG